MNGHRNPLVSEYGQPHPRLKNVLKGIHRVQGSSTRPRLPITADILRRMCNILNEGVFGPYVDLLLQSAFLLAFFGFLRCSEFTSTTHKFDPQRNLCFGDVTTTASNGRVSCLSVRLKSSKTDQFRRGFNLRLFPTGTAICPVSTLLRFMSVRQAMCPSASEPFILLPERTPLDHNTFTTFLRTVLSRIGLRPDFFAGHSFRIGAATSAAASQIPDHLIQTLGRWSSNCYRLYIRTSETSLRHAFQRLAS
ncbi:uncharacterized protein [Ptychodera flava]|uniref:uncharacterized protein n=1 Tax=Ptychodera flava TaxID=63121 RepID=UPI00396A3A4D